MGLVLFFTAFIPLYPKLPLLDVAQSWVYIRVEDVLVAVSVAILGMFYLKEKRFPNTPLTVPIAIYLGVGGISLVSALIFIFPHLGGLLFPKVGVLHYIRRFEYLSVFFLGFETFRLKKSLHPLVITITATLALVSLYGFGQKFLGFPAFLTMNEEFAKGIPLRLPSTARFPSTFGGHYDVAAYLVVIIPLVWSFCFGVKELWKKALLWFTGFLGVIMLLFTASRTSFGVYIISVSAMYLWHKKPLYIIPFVIMSFLTMNLVGGMAERFYKTFQMSNVVVDLSTGKPIGTLESIEGKQATLEVQARPDEDTLPKGSEFISVPNQTTVPDKKVDTVTFYDSRDLATGSGEMATISGSFLIQKALVYDISITTRMQGQWPRAMEAFKRNMLLGSGFSSLSNAVDGDYHRMLGETGILGTVAFLGLLAYAFYLFVTRYTRLGGLERSFVVGLFGGMVGLLVNAVLIDVFEASKVAFTVYLLLGVAIAILSRVDGVSPIPYLDFMKRLLTHPVMLGIYIFIFSIYIWNAMFSVYFIGDDFTWLRWAAESRISEFPSYFSEATGFFYRPIPKMWYFMLFSLFWLKPIGYHIMSFVLMLGTTLGIVLLARARNASTPVLILGSVFFVSMAVHHENLIWISGQSSLLAGFFLIWSLVLLQWIPVKHGIQSTLLTIGSFMFLFASMASYDGLILAPVAYAIIAWGVFGLRTVSVTSLILPFFYWWMRTKSDAVPASGDYGYAIAKLPVNIVANSVSYVASMFAGPDVLNWFTTLRMHAKQYLPALTAVIGAIVVLKIALFVRFKRTVMEMKDVFFWLLAGFVVMLPYTGLGGVADRYAYIPSMFIVISVMTILALCIRKKFTIGVALISFLMGVSIYGNIRAIPELIRQWQYAGAVVERSILSIKTETFPPKNEKTFAFVNVPIRYGRAWVFPTGLGDAIWHMYRQSPYKAYTVTTVEEAFAVPMTGGDKEAFIFDGYVMKRALEVIKPLEAPVQK